MTHSTSLPPARRAWPWLAALTVLLLAALVVVAHLLSERQRHTATLQQLRQDAEAAHLALQQERRRRLDAENELRQSNVRRLAHEAQTDALIDEIGARLVSARPPTAAFVARELREALAAGRPPGEVVEALGEQTVRDLTWAYERWFATEMTLREGGDAATGEDFLTAALLYRYGRDMPGRARELLDRAIERGPGLVEAYHQRASLRLAEGDTSRARLDVRVALELQPNLWRGWTLLGRIEAERGRAEYAADAFARAASFAPAEYAQVVEHVRRESLAMLSEDVE